MSNMGIIPKRQKMALYGRKVTYFCFLCILAIFERPIHMFVKFMLVVSFVFVGTISMYTFCKKV